MDGKVQGLMVSASRGPLRTYGDIYNQRAQTMPQQIIILTKTTPTPTPRTTASTSTNTRRGVVEQCYWASRVQHNFAKNKDPNNRVSGPKYH